LLSSRGALHGNHVAAGATFAGALEVSEEELKIMRATPGNRLEPKV
jgi:hypothetical protein